MKFKFLFCVVCRFITFSQFFFSILVFYSFQYIDEKKIHSTEYNEIKTLCILYIIQLNFSLKTSFCLYVFNFFFSFQRSKFKCTNFLRSKTSTTITFFGEIKFFFQSFDYHFLVFTILLRRELMTFQEQNFLHNTLQNCVYSNI